MPALKNHKYELFALRVAAGENPATAYYNVYNKSSPTACRSQAHVVINYPHVLSRIEELKKQHNATATKKFFLSRDEKRMGLADVWRVDIASFIDDQGRIDMKAVKKLPAWCIDKIKVKETTRTTKDGDTVTTLCVEVELLDRLKALEIDNSMEERFPDDIPLVEDIPQTEADQKRKLAAERARSVVKELGYHGSGVIDV